MPGIKTAAVICHARFLDLASFGEILGQKGYEVRYYDAGQDSLSLDGEPDVLITLGGPVGAYDRSDYPWIDDEMELATPWVAQLKKNRPVTRFGAPVAGSSYTPPIGNGLRAWKI